MSEVRLTNMHQASRLSLVLLCFMVLSADAFAIVNMDGLHFKDSDKTFSSDFELNLSGSTGNSENSTAAANGQFSWKKEKSINLAILGYQYGEVNQIENTNKSFIHLRHIHNINDSYDAEFFTQIEQNNFTRLEYRGLLGTGLRFTPLESSDHHAFIGIGAFYSKEKIKPVTGLTDEGIETAVRANLYFLTKHKFTSHLNNSNAFYYQPDIEEFSDYRALFQSKLDFKINENLKFRLSLDVSHDSKPSQTIKKTDFSYLTGVVVSY